MWWGQTADGNMAARCILDFVRLHARKHTPTLVHPRPHLRSCTHAHFHTHKYVMLIAFHGNDGFMNASQCYVIRTLSVLVLIDVGWGKILIKICSQVLVDIRQPKLTLLTKPYTHFDVNLNWNSLISFRPKKVLVTNVLEKTQTRLLHHTCINLETDVIDDIKKYELHRFSVS